MSCDDGILLLTGKKLTYNIANIGIYKDQINSYCNMINDIASCIPHNIQIPNTVIRPSLKEYTLDNGFLHVNKHSIVYPLNVHTKFNIQYYSSVDYVWLTPESNLSYKTVYSFLHDKLKMPHIINNNYNVSAFAIETAQAINKISSNIEPINNKNLYDIITHLISAIEIHPSKYEYWLDLFGKFK
jgi:hypothetical protein